MGILMKSMRVIQGYVTVARLIEILVCGTKNRNRLKLVAMDNSLHVWITVRKNRSFQTKNAKKLSKNYLYNTTMIK